MQNPERAIFWISRQLSRASEVLIIVLDSIVVVVPLREFAGWRFELVYTRLVLDEILPDFTVT